MFRKMIPKLLHWNGIPTRVLQNVLPTDNGRNCPLSIILRPGAAPLVPFLAAPHVGRAAVWASVPFGTYQVGGSSQMG